MKLSLDALKANALDRDVLSKITGGNKLLCHPGLKDGSAVQDGTYVKKP